MSAGRDLPARPSLDSLRKQAKKLARDAAAGNGESIGRVHAQLPHAALPLSNRDAQLVIAREYGFSGWPDLTAEVQRRLGQGLEWAAAQAKTAIHNEEYDRLRALLVEYPALVTWRGEHDQTLVDAIMPYALDCSNPERERLYTRPVAAEMLIDAGIPIERKSWEYLIAVGASGMLHLLARKHVLPPTLPVLAALGDADGIRARLAASHRQGESDGADERIVIGRAVLNACRFKHTDIALQLLDRAIALDPDLGGRIDRWGDPQRFVDFLIQHSEPYWSEGRENTPWQSFVIRQLTVALDNSDLPTFQRWLDEEPWVLQSAFLNVQTGLIERASYGRNTDVFITTLLEHDPALRRMKAPPKSSAMIYALDSGNAHLVPILTRVWPLPDDLPHAAGIGDGAAVARWFDAAGRPVLGPLQHHHNANDPKRIDLGWEVVGTQQILDVALAWAVLNRHFDIASFLLERGADIDTNWGTHEPASILHEAAIQGNAPAVKFLLDHGADLTIEDYRYQSTAEGWARYGSHDEPMAHLLAAAAAERNAKSASRSATSL